MSDEKTSAEFFFSSVVYEKETHVRSIELYKMKLNGVGLYQLICKDEYYSDENKNETYTHLTLLGTGETTPETFRNSYHDTPDDYDILKTEESYYNWYKDEYSSLDKQLFDANKKYITLNKKIWDADTEETTEEDIF